MKIFLGCIICLILYSFGCAPIKGKAHVPPGSSLAVAASSQPTTSWQMLAGYPPADGLVVSSDGKDQFNKVLADSLSQRGRAVQSQAVTRQCEEIVLSDLKDKRVSALEYWVRVGKCFPADFVIVPHIFEWKERLGGEWGVEAPAGVVFDLYLIDVKSASLVQRFHFEEQQKSLTENILDAPKFFSRGAKWVSAEQLAAGGVTQALTEFGL